LLAFLEKGDPRKEIGRGISVIYLNPLKKGEGGNPFFLSRQRLGHPRLPREKKPKRNDLRGRKCGMNLEGSWKKHLPEKNRRV